MVCCLIGCQGNLALYIGSSQCKLENALRLYKTCTSFIMLRHSRFSWGCIFSCLNFSCVQAIHNISIMMFIIFLCISYQNC